MKRAIIILLVALTATVTAQQAVLSKGNESKYVDPYNLSNGTYVGDYQGLDCWLFSGKKHLKQLVMTDHNLMTLNVVDLPRSNNAEILAATNRGNHVAALVADRSGKRQTAVLSYRLDLDSLSVLAVDTIDTFSYSRKDSCLLWAATSPNKQYNAFIAIVQYMEKKQYRTLITLFDAEMHPLWNKEFALGSMHDMKVTDEGTIVTLGEERDGEESHFIFNIIKQNSANSYDVVVKCDPVKETRLLGVIGSHVLAAGLFTPIEQAHPERYTGGLYALSFDMDSVLLTGFLMRPFQNEDLNILYNQKTKKVQREQIADRVRLLDAVTTSYGAVVAVGRSYRTNIVEANGVVNSTFSAMGIHCVAIDSLGQLRWVRNIRRNDKQKQDDDLLRLSLLNHNGDVAIVKSEAPKYPAIYDIAKDAPLLNMGSKNTLVIYSVNGDGEVSKLAVENKSKHSFLRAFFRPDGTLMLLTARGNKTRLAQLKFTE